MPAPGQSEGYDTLNPNLAPSKQEDWDRASQGVRIDTTGDETTARTIKGAGDWITSVVKAKDEYNQERIRRESTEAYDQITDQWTAQGMTPGTGAETGQHGPLSDPGVPEDLIQRGERLQRLKQGYQSGKFGESHYWTLIDMESRRLRNKYPGYREQIDNIFQDLTGSTPANALRRSIMSEAGKDDGTKERTWWEHKAAELGLDYLFDPTYTDKWGAVPLDMLKLQVSNREKIKAEMSLEEQKLALNRTRQADKERDTFNVMNREANLVMNDAVNRGTSVFGKTWDDFNDTTARVMEDSKSGKMPSGEDVIKLRANMADMSMKYNKTLDDIMYKVRTDGTRYADNLSPEQKKAFKQEHADRLGLFQDSLINQNFGILSLLKDANGQMQEGDLNRMMADQTLRAAMTIRKAFGDTYLNSTAMADFNAKGADINTGLKNWFTTGIVSGDQPSVGGAIKKAQETNPGAVDSSFTRGAIDQSMKIAVDPKGPAEARGRAMNALYGDGNRNFLSLFPGSEHPAIFQRMATPQMAQNAYEMGRNGQPQVWRNYQQWVTEAGLETLSGQVHAAKSMFHPNSYAGIIWNPQTQQFGLIEKTPTRRVTGNLFGSERMARMTEMKIGQVAVDSLNRSIGAFKPIIELNGDNANEAFKRSFQARFGINLDNMTPPSMRVGETAAPKQFNDRVPQEQNPYMGMTIDQLRSVDVRKPGARKQVTEAIDALVRQQQPDAFVAPVRRQRPQ